MTDDGKVEKEKDVTEKLEKKAEPEKAERKVDPRIRVMTYGKAWADLLRRDPSSQTKYILFSVGNAGYHLSPKDFEAVRDPSDTPELYNLLTENSTAASSTVLKLQYYVRKAQVVLIDTDVLDSALGHEILRNAFAMRKPAYAVGVTSSTSPLVPYYVKGIVFPGTIRDLHDLIDRAVIQTAPAPLVIRPPTAQPTPRGELIEKLKAVPQPSRGEPIRKSEAPLPPSEEKPHAVETL